MLHKVFFHCLVPWDAAGAEGNAMSLSFMHSVGLRQPLHFPDLSAIREGQKCFR